MRLSALPLIVTGLTARPWIACTRAALRTVMSESPLSDEDRERRIALRLPEGALVDEPLDDSGDPLGGGDADSRMFEQVQFRVRRRAEGGEYDQAISRSLPLVALAAQVGLCGALGLGLGYCWLLNFQADAGETWAVDALAKSDAWFPQIPPPPFPPVFSRPPAGPFVAVYAAANMLNAVRCAPLLFDRVLVAQLPNSDQWQNSTKVDLGVGASEDQDAPR